MEIIIKKPLEALRTHLKSGSIHYMKNRHCSGIVMVLQGKMDFVFDDITISCERGHGIYLPEGIDYTIYALECTWNLLLNFRDESDGKPMPIEVSDYPLLEKLFEEAEREFLKAEPRENKLFSVFYQIFSELFDRRIPIDKGEMYVKLAEESVIKNISDVNLSCNSVSSEINVSEVYLRKLFSKYRGISPSKYIIDIRMNKAHSYLSEGYPVGETAEMVGYSDIYQFSRVYKKYFGYSPTKTVQKIKL